MTRHLAFSALSVIAGGALFTLAGATYPHGFVPVAAVLAVCGAVSAEISRR